EDVVVSPRLSLAWIELTVSAKLIQTKVWFRRNWMCNGQISDLILVDSLIDSGLIPRGSSALDTSLVTLFDGKNL
ncbi:hypothetical protein LINPERPRIM_LOCUS4877, partial [Linum perenne]